MVTAWQKLHRCGPLGSQRTKSSSAPESWQMRSSSAVARARLRAKGRLVRGTEGAENHERSLESLHVSHVSDDA